MGSRRAGLVALQLDNHFEVSGSRSRAAAALDPADAAFLLLGMTFHNSVLPLHGRRQLQHPTTGQSRATGSRAGPALSKVRNGAEYKQPNLAGLWTEALLRRP